MIHGMVSFPSQRGPHGGFASLRAGARENQALETGWAHLAATAQLEMYPSQALHGAFPGEK